MDQPTNQPGSNEPGTTTTIRIGQHSSNDVFRLLELANQAQRLLDERSIALWLLLNVPTIPSIQEANAWATIIMSQATYKRDQPWASDIPDFEFTLPATASLRFELAPFEQPA